MDKETPSVTANLVELRLHLLVLESAVPAAMNEHLAKAIHLTDTTLAMLRAATGAGVSSLTMREQSLLPLLAQGLSNRHIAMKLGLSEATVKGYLRQLQQKLGTSNRVQTALKAKHLA